jgi:hypothetical protein
VLITRDEFGDEPPRTADTPRTPGGVLAVERLRQLDTAWGLKPGDVVVLGTPELNGRMAARLGGLLPLSPHPPVPTTSPSGDRPVSRAPVTPPEPPRPRRVIPNVDRLRAQPTVDH